MRTTRRTVKKPTDTQADKDPLWYKKAVIYQAHVRAFSDSDANGIGDFRGLTAKLDYLQDLGVTAVWLLPFYPSPLRDDGYDIADYFSINPIYGNLNDFKAFLREAHRRDLRVITELVINHTSDQHPWFQKSRRAAPGSKWRDFYVWSDSVEKYKEARIIFKDFELSNWTWDPVAKAFFWHRFYFHQPDLNFENPAVHEEILKVLDFWLDLGVDGLRLDAVPYLFEREGTSCENLPETHLYLKSLRTHIDQKYGDRMLLAEANQWPEDAVAYFGENKGDECHMAFHFPLMPRLFMAVRMEDRVPIVDILEQTPAIPESSQWAVFLRNHDELTLEMVTDEERDYMYRTYAMDPKARINLGIRRRLAPLLGNDRKRIELLNALLLSLPGTPVMYYGDEIGLGENIHLGDRNGVRTPMQWSSDRNAGFSRCNPQGLYLPVVVDPGYHYETVNVEAQQQNPHSLLWWMKRMLAVRKKWKAFGLGTIRFLQPENRKILAYLRQHEDECILVVANLSRFVQPVELDLSEFQQTVPVEIFGQNAFPPITDKPYFLTLSPHSFFWFSMKPRFATAATEAPSTEPATRMPVLSVADKWEAVFQDRAKTVLEHCLPDYVRTRRWFRSKTKEIASLSLTDLIPVATNGERCFVALLQVDYVNGDPEDYVLPLAHAVGQDADRIQQNWPQLVVAGLQIKGRPEAGILYDACGCSQFSRALFETISRRRSLKGKQGELTGWPTAALKAIGGGDSLSPEPVLSRAEQSNTAVIFGDKFIFKLFRHVETGVNPDIELSRFLTARKYPHTPPLAGSLEYRKNNGDVMSLGILSALVPGSKDAWEYTLDALGRYFERVWSLPEETRTVPADPGSLLSLVDREIPGLVPERIGTFLESARLLGERTASMHLALASEPDDKEYAPEPFTPFYQRALYQSMRNLATENFKLLKKAHKSLPAHQIDPVDRVLLQEKEILKRFESVFKTSIVAKRIRCHGDFHLGQVLYTGKDFVIIDFEGEPARSLSSRRLKRSPLRDVAGMLRSLHYASHAALIQQAESGTINEAATAGLKPWAEFWSKWVSVVYLKAYLDGTSQGDFLPQSRSELKTLLDAYVLEKAVYELGYELNNRPGWLNIPLQGILQILEVPSAN
ncbi:MAG: maltose alpha-D-glucosyltransferase [Verrucomicrobia bacterium]|nr:maltose alpha-D-glucosyltransferase [Verrucomicrobiota bacterium]